MGTYKQPGVYIQEQVNPAFSSATSGARVVGIVGTGLTTLTFKNQAVVKGVANGLDAIPIVAGTTIVAVTIVGDYVDYDQYKTATDYAYIPASTSIQWRSTSVQQPTTGSTYYVTYTYAKASADYSPKTYDNIQDVRDFYGYELTNGNINTITLAANLVLANNAASIVVSQATTGSNTDIQTAIDNIGNVELDLLVCPNATNTTLRNYLLNHVNSQSTTTNRHERIAIIAADGLSDTVATQAAVAGSMASQRLTIVSPPAITVTMKDKTTNTDTDVLVTSHYMGAAYAGMMADPSYDVAEPKTRKTLVGIKDLSSFNYTAGNMNTLGASGVTVIYNDNGIIRVRHAVTTDVSNINNLTQSVVQIKDFIRKNIRTRLDTAFIGTKITNTTNIQVASAIKSALDSWIGQAIINAYKDISVSQNQQDPRQLDVSFNVSVVYPLEFISVTFSLYI